MRMQDLYQPKGAGARRRRRRPERTSVDAIPFRSSLPTSFFEGNVQARREQERGQVGRDRNGPEVMRHVPRHGAEDDENHGQPCADRNRLERLMQREETAHHHRLHAPREDRERVEAKAVSHGAEARRIDVGLSVPVENGDDLGGEGEHQGTRRDSKVEHGAKGLRNLRPIEVHPLDRDELGQGWKGRKREPCPKIPSGACIRLFEYRSTAFTPVLHIRMRTRRNESDHARERES